MSTFCFLCYFQEVNYLSRGRRDQFDDFIADFYIYKEGATKCGAVICNNRNEVK